MEIRPVRASDVPAVVALVTRVLGEFGLEFGKGSKTDEELLALPGSYDRGAFWVGVERSGVAGPHSGETLLGTCAMYPLETHVFELRKMYLSPASRGRGLGKQLLDVALAWVRARGGTTIVLDTAEAMTRAIAFYEANGFVRDDAQIRGARCSRGYRLDL